MNIFVFGSSLTSTFWNGAATYYRGIYKNLNRLGHQITFAEPAIYGRQEHKDAGEISYADIRVYKSAAEIPGLLAEAARNAVVIKHSGAGAEDARLEADVLTCRSQMTRVLFWDVDAPATLARLETVSTDPFRLSFLSTMPYLPMVAETALSGITCVWEQRCACQSITLSILKPISVLRLTRL
ncbi:MAG TPA: hypothetical protein VGS27_11945 [Candidatus Sulfotelmatobacter sp.]|nr:hypothetical protein [Candidatus Sulfotelmatobacter sp.]